MKIPRHLKKDGKTLFKQLVDEYGITDAGGIALVTTAAECLDRLRAAQVAIERDGEVVLDRYSQAKIHPACALEKDARSGFLAALKMLNLDLEPLRDAPGRPPARF